MNSFSERHGFQAEDAEISVREDAPRELRGVLVDIAYEGGMNPHTMRSLVCRALRAREDPNNWSAFPNVDGEVRSHLDACQWWEVYDVIEAIYGLLANVEPSGAGIFEGEINKGGFKFLAQSGHCETPRWGCAS